MQTKIQKRLAAFVVLGLMSVTLSACSKPAENSADVIAKFQKAASGLQSGKMKLKASVEGAEAGDSLDFSGSLDLAFDRKDPKNEATDLKVAMEGAMKASGKEFQGKLALALRAVGQDFYVNLESLEANDPGFKSAEPFLKAYMGKWLRLSSDLIPENLRAMQNKDEAALAKEKELRQLFAESKLFTVSKEYGIETVGGVKAYHYGITLDPEAIKTYVKKASAINGRELTEAEVADSVGLAQSITGAEAWIGVKDYQLYKAVLSVKADAVEKDSKAVISLTLEGSDYNKPQKITKPEGAEEFNPLALLMGAQGLGGAALPSGN